MASKVWIIWILVTSWPHHVTSITLARLMPLLLHSPRSSNLPNMLLSRDQVPLWSLFLWKNLPYFFRSCFLHLDHYSSVMSPEHLSKREIKFQAIPFPQNFICVPWIVTVARYCSPCLFGWADSAWWDCILLPPSHHQFPLIRNSLGPLNSMCCLNTQYYYLLFVITMDEFWKHTVLTCPISVLLHSLV